MHDVRDFKLQCWQHVDCIRDYQTDVSIYMMSLSRQVSVGHAGRSDILF